jgi:large subunit ribosomal protein L20
MTFIKQRKLLQMSKGFYGRAKNCIRVAAPKVERALKFAYAERKMKKRIKREEWIMTINAASREHGLPYSRLIYGLNHSNLQLDRKILADLSKTEPLSFKSVVDEIKLQVGLSVEERYPDFSSVSKAVAEGVLSKPGSALPPVKEMMEKGSTKPFDFYKYFKFKYTKPPRPSQDYIDKAIARGDWDSDLEDDRHYAN